MPFPVFAAGQRLQAAQLTAMQPLTVRKVTDESLANNTTLQDDDSLLLPVEANATYDFELNLHYSADSDRDLKIGFSLSSGFMEYLIHGQLTGTTGTSSAVDTNRYFLGSTPALGGSAVGSNTAILAALFTGTVNVGGTPGNFVFRFAQNSSGAVASIVRGSSSLTLQRTN